MTIDSDFLTVGALKSLELRTLQFLSNCKVINEEEGFVNFLSTAKICSNALSAKKKLLKSPIDFQSYFNLVIGKKWQRFHIGSLIQSDYSQVTYYLAICDYNVTCQTCEIRRKFHFDYDNGNGPSRQPHPRYHIQYAGTKPSGMGNHGDDHYESVLYSQLSEPRFHYAPMSLALLLNCVFVEFRTEITNKISEDDNWRELIKRNEIELLEPYYRKCKDFFAIGGHSKTKLFSTDYCYGK